jgi:hypothetical protein
MIYPFSRSTRDSGRLLVFTGERIDFGCWDEVRASAQMRWSRHSLRLPVLVRTSRRACIRSGQHTARHLLHIWKPHTARHRRDLALSSGEKTMDCLLAWIAADSTTATLPSASTPSAAPKRKDEVCYSDCCLCITHPEDLAARHGNLLAKQVTL